MHCPVDYATAEDLHVGLDDKVKGGKAAQGEGEELPSLQHPWKPFLVVSLHVVDQLDCCEGQRKEGEYGVEKDCVEEGEANEEEREEKDGDEEVEDGEPLVVHHLAAPQLGAEERPA